MGYGDMMEDATNKAQTKKIRRKGVKDFCEGLPKL